MKTLGLVFCLFAVTVAVGQTASLISGEAHPLQIPDHPEHASQQSLGQERSLLTSHAFVIATGERPLWEVAGHTAETPLGDIARQLKREHATAKKAVMSLEK